MGLEKTKTMNDLVDLYGKLLTKNQLLILELYYQEDLTLAEIGENLSITRSAVSDSLKKSSNILYKYENKLKLLEKENKKKELLKDLEKFNHQQIKEKIEEL